MPFNHKEYHSLTFVVKLFPEKNYEKPYQSCEIISIFELVASKYICEVPDFRNKPQFSNPVHAACVTAKSESINSGLFWKGALRATHHSANLEGFDLRGVERESTQLLRYAALDAASATPIEMGFGVVLCWASERPFKGID